MRVGINYAATDDDWPNLILSKDVGASDTLDMPLVKIDSAFNGSSFPEDVNAFLREANLRVGQFVEHNPVHLTGFVPSSFTMVYQSLRAVVEAKLAQGNLFCEWGSGFGVVASLAGMLGFDAYGIEIDRTLYDASRSLAGAFELPVKFIHGNFIPRGDVKTANGFDPKDANAYQQLGLDVHDFDVVFAYPWPSEEQAIGQLFERHAHEGALLVTFNQYNFVQLHRKVRQID